jgi:hypothetical protein
MRTLLLASSVLAAFSASAQNSDFVDAMFYIDESAMIRAVDAQGNNLTDLTFHIVSPNIPGQAYLTVPNQTMYLQYTSVKTAAPDDSRTISVDVIGGNFPQGVTASLAANPSGTGATGDGNEIQLSQYITSGTLVEGIGSAYSGTGAGKGIPVIFSIDFATENLDASTAGMVSLQFTVSNSSVSYTHLRAHETLS